MPISEKLTFFYPYWLKTRKLLHTKWSLSGCRIGVAICKHQLQFTTREKEFLKRDYTKKWSFSLRTFSNVSFFPGHCPFSKWLSLVLRVSAVFFQVCFLQLGELCHNASTVNWFCGSPGIRRYLNCKNLVYQVYFWVLRITLCVFLVLFYNSIV